MLAPLDEETRTLAGVLETEWLFSVRGTLDLERGLSSWGNEEGQGLITENSGIVDRLAVRFFFLPNATVNETYSWHSELMKVEASSGEDYRRSVVAYHSKKQDEENSAFSYLSFRNPVGHILNHIARFNMLKYLKARDDLLALRQAVSFHHEIVLNETPDDEIEMALDERRLLHRFTGRQAVWDRGDRELVYPCSSELDVDEYRIGF